jgi:hypothetical protein
VHGCAPHWLGGGLSLLFPSLRNEIFHLCPKKNNKKIITTWLGPIVNDSQPTYLTKVKRKKACFGASHDKSLQILDSPKIDLV